MLIYGEQLAALARKWGGWLTSFDMFECTNHNHTNIIFKMTSFTVSYTPILMLFLPAAASAAAASAAACFTAAAFAAAVSLRRCCFPPPLLPLLLLRLTIEWGPNSRLAARKYRLAIEWSLNSHLAARRCRLAIE